MSRVNPQAFVDLCQQKSIGMKLKTIFVLLLLSLTTSVFSAKKEEVKFRSGNVLLSGTVMIPKGKGPFPAVVFLHGSGDATRDQNTWRAKKFVKQGYLVLIFDKRGTGKSEGTDNDWIYFSFDSLAQDAVAAIEYLKTRSDVIKEEIGIIAASQSGWVAPIAAARSKDISFMVVISASISTVAEDRLFERAARLKKEGFPKSQVAEATLMQKLDQEVTRNPSKFPKFQKLWEENKSKEWFPRVYNSEYFLQDPNTNDYRKWFVNVLDFDPKPFLDKIDIPVLWLFGDADIDRYGPVQKSITRVNSYIAKEKNFKVIQYDGADHNLRGADYFSDIFSWLNDKVQ